MPTLKEKMDELRRKAVAEDAARMLGDGVMDTMLDVLAEQEARICMLELGI